MKRSALRDNARQDPEEGTRLWVERLDTAGIMQSKTLLTSGHIIDCDLIAESSGLWRYCIPNPLGQGDLDVAP